MKQKIAESNNPTLIPVSSWPKYHDWPSANGLRNLIAKSPGNGFEQAITRVGKRILVNENKFFQWVKKQSKHPRKDAQ